MSSTYLIDIKVWHDYRQNGKTQLVLGKEDKRTIMNDNNNLAK